MFIRILRLTPSLAVDFNVNALMESCRMFPILNMSIDLKVFGEVRATSTTHDVPSCFQARFSINKRRGDERVEATWADA
jgi:hypothetical protein